MKTKILFIIIFLTLKSNTNWSMDMFSGIYKEKIICNLFKFEQFRNKYVGLTNQIGQNENGKTIQIDTLQNNELRQILTKKQSIKIELFSLLTSNICFGFEKSIINGINCDIKFGYVGLDLWEKNTINITGSYVKIGVKFLIVKENYLTPHIKYFNLLKGKYFKFELLYGNYKYIGATESYYQGNYLLHTKTDIRIHSGAIQFIYGKQFVFSKNLTFDCYFGFGYGYNFNVFSKKELQNKYNANDTSNFRSYGFSFFETPLPLIYSGGLSFGYSF